MLRFLPSLIDKGYGKTHSGSVLTLTTVIADVSNLLCNSLSTPSRELKKSANPGLVLPFRRASGLPAQGWGRAPVSQEWCLTQLGSC